MSSKYFKLTSLAGIVSVLQMLAVAELASADSALSTNKVPAGIQVATVSNEPQVATGRRLYDHNCAHCHGDDARGDEGPTLFDLTISDARITKNIKAGIKNEMPKFGSKFTDGDIKAIIAYLRTLKN